MKHRASVFTALAAFTVFVGWQSPARAQIALGSASSFEVLAGAGITVAGAVNSTTITGDIGTYPTLSITGLGNVVLTGVNHAGDSVTQSAKTSLVTAYGTAAGATPTTTYPPIKDLGGLTLPPGVYNDPSSFAITGLLQLDAAGDPNAVWIFQAGSTLTAATSSEVRLINNAQASNVYWQVGSSATLNGSAIFKGTILALTDITLVTGASVEGRLLARNGFVALDTNALALPLTPQTITFAAIATHTACDAAFTVAPTASSGLASTLVVTSGPATVAGNTVTLTGVGTVVLTASQAGNGTYSAATSVAQSFTVTACAPLPQTITFAAIPGHTACDPAFTVAPTASSGLATTLVVTSGPATVAGNTVTLTGAGTVVLTASQAGDGTYAAATSVAQSFAVTACGLTPQTITFAAVPAHTACDAAFTVAPTASSGLATTLVVTSGPATVAGNTVTLTGAGTVVLTVSQAGNGTYSAATSVAQSFTVTACALLPQTITLAAIPAHTACDPAFTVAPTASSGLATTLIVTSGPATVAGNTVTLTGVGTVVLTASQAGNGTYAAATSVAQSFTVTACGLTPQTITFAAIPGHTACDVAFTVAPTASSGLPVTLVVTSGPATVSGNTVTFTGSGTVVLTTSQAGNGTYAAAANVVRSFDVTPCALTPQLITFASIPGHTACDAAFPVAPIASSGLPVTLTVTSGPATVSGNTVTLTGATGTVVLTTSQAGNGTYAAAANVVQSFAVTACALTPQTIAFGPVPDHGLCEDVFTLNPTSSSGLPVTLKVTSGPATVSGKIVTLTGPGTVVLTATQAGDGTYASATSVSQTFVVTAVPVITNSSLTAAATVGTPFSYTITASGSPTSYTAFNLPPGLFLNPVTGVISGTPTASDILPSSATFAAASADSAPIKARTIGPTFVTITAVNGNCVSAPVYLIIVVAPAGVPPVITSPFDVQRDGQSLTPNIQAGTVGSPFAYQITATGSPTSYGAVNLPPGLSVNALTGAITGTPTVADRWFVTVKAGNAAGTGDALVIFEMAPTVSSRIVNFSARALSGPGGQALIMGFVVSGNGQSLLVRGVGPTLSVLGLANVLADPLLTLFGPAGAIVTNDDWQTTLSGQPSGALLAPTAARVGAFALLNGSKDAALLTTVNAGAYSASLLRPDSTTGVALTEIYDTDTVVGARLINVSARVHVSAGEGTLIAGFVIAGNAPKTVLIRGIGPTLATFAVTGALADPTIAVMTANTPIASNDNWENGTSTAAQIAAASARVGAFALPAGSRDAALLITLQPGAYTVLVTGVGDTAGVALIEIYDTQ